MLAAHFRQPARGLCRLFKIEQAGIEHAAQIDSAKAGKFEFGSRIQGVQDGQQAAQFGLAHQIGFVDDDDITELDLINQQIGYRALVLFSERFATITEQVFAGIVVEEIARVDHCDHGIESRELRQRDAVFIFKGKGFGNGQWFTDAGGFNHQIVEAAFLCQARDFQQQILAQSAADAAVGHFHQLFLGARQRCATVSYQRGIHIHFAHVIDDHRHAPTLAIVQNVVEQGGLAGTKKAGQNGDGETLISLHGFPWGYLGISPRPRPAPAARVERLARVRRENDESHRDVRCLATARPSAR